MQPRVKRVYVPKLKVFFVMLALAVLVVSGYRIARWGQGIMRETGLTPGTVFRLLVDSGATLKSLDKRTNILLMGIGGGQHAGADLTDTMLVLSFVPKTQALAMISVPRDIWSDTLRDKVNSAYHYGEEKKKGGGIVLAKAIVSDVLGLPIHYGLVIDFFGFQEVIDLVGGVHITVPTAFVDPEFPIEGKEDDDCDGDPEYRCRYEVLRFDAGLQVMDGARALKYVRTRLAQGEEGSDFARSRRQQEVLVGLKEQLASPRVWLSPKRVTTLVGALEKSTDTDMNIGELLTVVKLVATADQEQIVKVSLDDVVYAPPIIWYGRYVLIPRESFEEVHEFVRSKLN